MKLLTKKLMSKTMSESTSKKAYPNFDQMINISGTYDMNKWMQAVKTIYYEEKRNQINRRTAIQLVTKGWNINEINDFVNWLRKQNLL